MKVTKKILSALAVYSFVFCTFVAVSYAATINAASVSYSDVASAVSSASAGDTVIVPAGSATWASSLSLTKGIKLVGAGIDSTTITNGITNTGASDFCITINPTTIADNPYIEVTGFTIDANSEGGCISIRGEDNTNAYSNFRIHHNKLKNALDNNDSYMCVRIKGDCFGLIDNNQFENNYDDFKVYGDDQDSWDDYPGPDNMGSANFLYIEDNTSTGATHFILTSGEGARWVYRHNTVNNSEMGSGNALWDAHGDTNNDGVVGFEIYENTITADEGSTARSGFKTLDYRGGTGMVFNNTVQVTASGIRTYIAVREEYNSGACDDPVNNGYIWNNRNSINNSIIVTGDNVFGDYDEHDCIAEDTDWWDDYGADDTNFSYDIATNRPGTSADDDCYWETDTKKLYRSVGVNNWVLVYRPYVYPHPLSGSFSPTSSISAPDNLRIIYN